MKFGGTGDRNDPGLLCQQPSESDLTGCRLLPFRGFGQQINQGLIGFESFGRKARENVAGGGTGGPGGLVFLSREKPFPQGTVRNEADTEFLEGWQYFLLRASGPQRVLALHSGHPLYGVCTTNRLCGAFLKSAKLDLASRSHN